MKAFELSEHIEKPPREVFAAISNLTEAMKFLHNVTESKQLTEGPIGVGSRFRETRDVGGKEASADLTVTAYEPDTRFGVSTEAEGIAVFYRYDLSAEGAGTRITWLCELEAGGLRKAMLPVVGAVLKKEDGDHLRKLKAFLETG